MKNHICTFAALLLLPALYVGQQSYVPGYIVNAQGDTLRGEVKLNEKKPLDLYAKVMFKDKNGMQRTYKPAKIKAYGFDDKNFVSLDDNGEPGFYRSIVQGPISLYELSYEGLRMNKVITESEYFLLGPGDKNPQPVKSRNFKKQLQKYTSDHPGLVEEYAEEKEFDEEAAVSAITNYNAWKAGQPQE